jgi:amylosucrase
MDWQAAEKRRDETSPEGRLFSGLRRLEQLRAGHRAFDGEADVWVMNTASDQVLGIGRYRFGEKLVALFNFGDEEERIYVDELGELRDLISGEKVDKRKVPVPAGGFRWLLCDFNRHG